MVQRFTHNKRVGSHHPTPHRLAQPPGGVDQRLVAPPIQRIGSKQNTSGISLHKELHHYRQADYLMIDIVLLPVADRAWRPQGGPAAPDCLDDLGSPGYVQESLL